MEPHRHHQHHPLLLNPKTLEPYLPLPPPNSRIIITPPRLTDPQDILPILNDPRVSDWMGLPLPHRLEHAVKWIREVKDNSDRVLRELSEAEADDPCGKRIVVDGCPVNILREVGDDGSEVYLGDISIKRYNWVEITDQDERKRLVEENSNRSVGDPDIVWGFGDYLAPSHHGQGIMSAAIATILREWAIPRMHVRRMRENTIEGNVGSVRVFEKNGFELKETVPQCLEVKGKKFGLHILEWTCPSE